MSWFKTTFLFFCLFFLLCHVLSTYVDGIFSQYFFNDYLSLSSARRRQSLFGPRLMHLLYPSFPDDCRRHLHLYYKTSVILRLKRKIRYGKAILYPRFVDGNLFLSAEIHFPNDLNLLFCTRTSIKVLAFTNHHHCSADLLPSQQKNDRSVWIDLGGVADSLDIGMVIFCRSKWICSEPCTMPGCKMAMENVRKTVAIFFTSNLSFEPCGLQP